VNIFNTIKDVFGPVRHWRWMLALVVFSCGLAGFISGVEVSERDISGVNLATKIYYTMGLFILGGMDLGVPVSGPWWGKLLLWVGYFGAPLLTGSTIVDWVQQVVSKQNRWLSGISDHIVLVGTDDLAHSILEKIEALKLKGEVVVVEREISASQASEFTERYGARVVVGDFTNEYFLSTLRLSRAQRVILASENDFDNFEAASKILEQRPELGARLLVHCNRLRFMRAVSSSHVARDCIVFNKYHLAAQHLVESEMIGHFKSTENLDVVVLAGFGRFGQTVFEELQIKAPGEISQISILDVDADRRVLVANEQSAMGSGFSLRVHQGEIGHPEVWEQLEGQVDLSESRPFILLATGMDQENLRTGLWLKKKYPNAYIMVRTARPSHFSDSVCEAAGIHAIGLSQIIHDALPDEWIA
jgi:Trk K+ transport system NAD-binding subunit